MDTTNIPGWGTDLDKANWPAFPMWEKAPSGAHWAIPPKQELKFKEFHSIERPSMTSVFGTSVPAKGLSGLLRSFAYQYSEARFLHWLPLLLADRINVVEGIFEDLIRGHFPNVLAEMGWRAEWKYNRKGAVKKLVVGSAILAGVFFILRKNYDSKRTE